MKKAIYISFVFICLFISCNNKTSDKEKKDNNKKQKEMIKKNKTDALSPCLLKELESLIAYNDSVDKGSAISGDVYIVYFSKKQADCYVTIYQSLCYYQSFYPQSLSSPSYNIEGFVTLNNKMIAFYNLGSECNHGLIDITKLGKGKPKNFSDENSDLAIHTTYELSGNKYKIRSKDSLELVYSGYF